MTPTVGGGRCLLFGLQRDPSTWKSPAGRRLCCVSLLVYFGQINLRLSLVSFTLLILNKH